MRAGALKVRVTTISRSLVCSTVVLFLMGVGSFSLLASMDLLLLFQSFHYLVHFIEACGPKLAVALDPRCLLVQPERPQLAGPHATHLLRGDETGLLQNADVLLHSRQGHAKLLS